MKILYLGFLTMCFLSCASVHHEIEIEADPTQVWEVLTDSQSYSKWNPVLLDLKGDFEVGQEVSFQFKETEEKQYEVKAKVVSVIPNKLLNQKGGVWGIITYDHKYILEPVEKGTRVTIHEDYRGVYVPFWNHESVESAYAKVNQALKVRVLELKQKAESQKEDG